MREVKLQLLDSIEDLDRLQRGDVVKGFTHDGHEFEAFYGNHLSAHLSKNNHELVQPGAVNAIWFYSIPKGNAIVFNDAIYFNGDFPGVVKPLDRGSVSYELARRQLVSVGLIHAEVEAAR